MKKLIVLSIIALSLAATFSACTTYEEGPAFTVIPAESRIKGTWNQVEWYVNDELQDNTFIVNFTFNSDGTGSQTVTWGGITDTNDIDWEFNDDKTLIMFKNTDAEEWDEATVKRLTTKELWIVEDAGLFGIWEFRYEKV